MFCGQDLILVRGDGSGRTSDEWPCATSLATGVRPGTRSAVLARRARRSCRGGRRSSALALLLAERLEFCRRPADRLALLGRSEREVREILARHGPEALLSGFAHPLAILRGGGALGLLPGGLHVHGPQRIEHTRARSSSPSSR